MLVSYSPLAPPRLEFCSIHTQAGTNTSIDARQLHLSRLFRHLKTQRHRITSRLNRRRGAHRRQRERSRSYERCRTRLLSKQRAGKMARCPAESKALLEPKWRAARSDALAPRQPARATSRHRSATPSPRARLTHAQIVYFRAAPTAARRPP